MCERDRGVCQNGRTILVVKPTENIYEREITRKRRIKLFAHEQILKTVSGAHIHERTKQGRRLGYNEIEERKLYRK